jgi:SAM-dependent MidA family methyltransferase
MHKLELPEPGEEEKQHSARLRALIEQAIADAGGWIDFSQYMQLALYTPALGYYAAGLRKFGEQGDFVTAPEISPLFGAALAVPVAGALQSMAGGDLLEFGAGSGRLAVDLLGRLQQMQCLPRHYYIVELSAELRQRQQQALQSLAPDCADRVRWLDQLPTEKMQAVIIANEVLDAMPVKRFMMTESSADELGVACESDRLIMQSRPATGELLQHLQHLQQYLGCVLAPGYLSEINLNIQPWLAALANLLEQGIVYLIDYGYPRSEYYLPERTTGTFMGYYRHRAFDHALWYPGLQDMTAFVDFTAVAEAAVATGFDVEGFTSQGNFLMDCGLLELVENAAGDERQRLRGVQQIKTLTMNSEMGERFKVMALSMGLDMPKQGFRIRDYLYRL